MSKTQDQSEFFRGTANVGSTLKDAKSTDGSSTKSIPAFVLGEELADLADTDPRIVVLTADLAKANRTSDFAERHPDRFFNTGIAEKNMITISAGLAASGRIPFCATFSAFAALLGCEQIRTDCAYPHLPVRIVGHHSGISMGFYGTSHHSLEDLGIMRTIADLTVVCATDANHLRAIIRESITHSGAMYIRLGRGRDPEVYKEVPKLKFGKSIKLRAGSDLAIVTTGSEVHPSLEAASALADQGIQASVYDFHTLKPLDTDVIGEIASHGAVLTVEEHNRTNGLGTAIAEAILEGGYGSTRFYRHGVPDVHVPVGPPASLYSHYRLDAVGIAQVARELLHSQPRHNN